MNFNWLKLVALFVAVWLSLVNIGKFIRGHRIPSWNIMLQAAGIVTFVYLQWLA